MAVGSVSSASRQNAPGAGVLRTGEQQASTQEALKNPNAKRYYHRIKGAKFIMPNGLELIFMGGQIVTDDPDIIAELDKIANKSTSMVFTMKEGIAAVEAQEAAVADDAKDTAGTLPNKA